MFTILLYICIVPSLLNNPVFHALLTGDAALGLGNTRVRFFDEAISPFAGFSEENNKGFEELYEILPPKRKILYATRRNIIEPPGWQQLVMIKGLQFVFDNAGYSVASFIQPLPLNNEYVEEMMQLATLTKPGPFGVRTIEFGHYYGIFEDKKLVAMTGQRLHPGNYTEISAVCTHPNYLGKGYAAALLQHELSYICSLGQVPFLHVRDDNTRAIALYERLGFKLNGSMNFYFLERRS
jgi:GNAT superfamily N-acetyltransferase